VNRRIPAPLRAAPEPVEKEEECEERRLESWYSWGWAFFCPVPSKRPPYVSEEDDEPEEKEGAQRGG
jgi:hypothetical protein